MCSQHIAINSRTAETKRFQNFHYVRKIRIRDRPEKYRNTQYIQNDYFKYTETYHPYLRPDSDVSSGLQIELYVSQTKSHDCPVLPKIHRFLFIAYIYSNSAAIDSILGDPYGAAAAAGIDVDLAEHWQATAGVCGSSEGRRY